MNINTVIDHLNKKYDINLDSSYYQNISIWRDWWMGYYAPFHTFAEVGLDGKKKERKLYTLKMAKQVCEDWAYATSLKVCCFKVNRCKVLHSFL